MNLQRLLLTPLLLMAFALPGLASVDLDEQPLRDVVPADVVERYGFGWDYTAWEFDADGDRMDDRLLALRNEDGIDGLRMPDGFLPFFVQDGPGGRLVGLHVAFDIGVSPQDLQRVERLGVEAFSSRHVPSVWVPDATLDQAAAIAQVPGVHMVELAPRFRALNTVAMDTVRADASTTYADDVHNDLGYKGTGIGIAIMDTGTDDEHPHFGDRFVAGANTAYPCYEYLEVDPDDDNVVTVGIIGVGLQTFHGTHVAGTALGLQGAAPDAELFEAKVLTGPGIGCLGSLAAGVEWIMDWNDGVTLTQSLPTTPTGKKIDVVNLSLGSSCSNGSDGSSQWMDILVTTGVTAVIAMGNDGLADCVTSPAAAAKAIAVGAFDDHSTASRTGDSMASFSNCKIGSTKPDVAAPGVNLASAQGHIVPEFALSGTHELSGTSMATPVVTGTVALMLEADPELEPAEVKQILRESAEHKGSSGGPPKKDTCWGYGELDAYGAVKRAQDIASGSVSAPATVAAGGSASVTLAMDYTKTEFMNHGPGGAGSYGEEDVVDFQVLMPSGWSGTVDSYDQDLSGALTAGSNTVGPGPHLVLEYDGDVDGGGSSIDAVEAVPTVDLSLDAPSTLGAHAFVAVFSINGIEHQVPFSITVV